MTCRPHSRIIFITGTGTGVGKTVLTGLLLTHLRGRNVPAFATKPFCSGDRADAKLLCALQGGDLTLEEVNPFFFREPVAPLVAARRRKSVIPIDSVLANIRSLRSKIEESWLLIEGAGGLLVPLGEDYSVLDLIASLRCEVLVVSANRLGTLNHTLLTVRALQQAGIAHMPMHPVQPAPRRSGRGAPRMAGLAPSPSVIEHSKLSKVVLMNFLTRDPASASNPQVLAQLLAPLPLIAVPFLGKNASCVSAVRRAEKKLEKTLARILD